MRGSMYKTFAAKYNTSVKKIRDKYTHDDIFSVEYQTKEGMKRCEFYHDGFTHSKQCAPANVDNLPLFTRYTRSNSFANRLKAGICELCGTKTDGLRMHHIRRLKDLTGATPAELLMMQKRRKTLALCDTCFEHERANHTDHR